VTVKVNKKFLKDLSGIPTRDRQKIEQFVFKQSKKISSVEEGGVFEKLKGYQTYYRIRFGNYRVGVSYQDAVLTFQRGLHRKEIYRYFP
jgi:mRNA interferase RelE/StbE